VVELFCHAVSEKRVALGKTMKIEQNSIVNPNKQTSTRTMKKTLNHDMSPVPLSPSHSTDLTIFTISSL